MKSNAMDQNIHFFFMCATDENLSLKEKVEQLRRRRMEVEERVRNTQAQIDRLRAADANNQRQLGPINPFSLP